MKLSAWISVLAIVFFIPHDKRVGAKIHGPIVTTSLGRILGSSKVSASGREFFVFRGIRYAKPPKGHLRFRDPVAIESWKGIFDGTREGPSCSQYNPLTGRIEGSEDCLTLNVYTNTLATNVGASPVMVWIHGGGWFYGSGNGNSDIYGPGLFVDRDIVLVTVNYRLGPFGFLSTEDEEAPGNYGLLDQTMALAWVRDHIAHFGGRPDSVTIFGEDAGGASVQYHILSPLSAGLFQRAIAQSGSSLCPWAMLDDAASTSRLLASKMDCPTSNSSALLDCLRAIAADYIIPTPNDLQFSSVVFGPRIDTERAQPFLPDYPVELYQNGNFSQVPLIVGTSRNDGARYLASSLAGSGKKMRDFEASLEEALSDMLRLDENEHSNILTQHVVDQYRDPSESYYQKWQRIEQVFYDRMFFKCVHLTVDLHRQYSLAATYNYFVNYRGWNKFTLPPTEIGGCNGNDLFTLLSSQNVPSATSQDHHRVSVIFLDLWTSFATEGHPISDSVSHWSPVGQGDWRSLIIDKDSIESEEVMPSIAFKYEELDFPDSLTAGAVQLSTWSLMVVIPTALVICSIYFLN